MNGFIAFVLQVFKTPTFYTAMFGFCHAVIFYFLPNFPRDILAGADMVISVVAGVYCGKEVAVKQSAALIASLQAELRTYKFGQ